MIHLAIGRLGIKQIFRKFANVNSNQLGIIDNGWDINTEVMGYAMLNQYDLQINDLYRITHIKQTNNEHK